MANLSDPDPIIWAQAFYDEVISQEVDITEELMAPWFAQAIECGRANPLPSTPLPEIEIILCPIHNVDNNVCGGPHRKVHTELGDEILAPGEEPEGTPY